MARALVPIVSGSIFMFGLLISDVIVFGRVLPTKQLVYVSSQRNRSDLFLLDLYHRIQVDLIKEAFTPAWSPDGERLAFYSTRDGGRDLYILDVYTQHLQRLTNNGANNASPSWSPDSRHIVYSAQNTKFRTMEILIMDTECRASIGCTCPLFSDIVDLMPAWSSDGSSIVFVDARDGSFEMYTTDTDGRYLQRLTYNHNDESSPRWRP